jgi:hypothetical protein
MRTRLLLFGIVALVFVPARLAPAADPPAASTAPEKEAKSDAQPKPAEKSAEKPAERDVIVAHVEGGYEIDFDVTETPELKEWVTGKLQPACVEWYPKIVAMLPSEGFDAPKKFPVIFRRNGRGVAATGGTRVFCDYPWFSKNLEGEAVGAVIHELVHVVQQYGRARRAEGERRAEGAPGAPGTEGQRPPEGQRRQRNPSYLVEGLADWIRWFNFEPEKLRPHPNAERAKYTDSYRTTAHFLDYVVQKYDKDLIRKLNTLMREGKYDDAWWKQTTGKTLEELGAEWKETLKTQGK